MPHLELIFLHSERADGYNARRVRTADVSTPDAEPQRQSKYIQVDDLAGVCAFLLRRARRNAERKSGMIAKSRGCHDHCPANRVEVSPVLLFARVS
jgi:hypothetical protein